MFEDLSTQEWFFLALAAGTGFLVVRHFMDKLPKASRNAEPPPGQAMPPQGKTRAVPEAGPDASTWFRRGMEPNEDAARDGHPGGGADARQGPGGLPQAWYRVLEVSPTAPVADIRTAYKRKMRQYHPDKVAGLGPEFTAIAEAKAKDINQAYQQACAERGIGDPSS